MGISGELPENSHNDNSRRQSLGKLQISSAPLTGCLATNFMTNFVKLLVFKANTGLDLVGGGRAGVGGGDESIAC